MQSERGKANKFASAAMCAVQQVGAYLEKSRIDLITVRCAVRRSTAAPIYRGSDLGGSFQLTQLIGCRVPCS